MELLERLALAEVCVLLSAVLPHYKITTNIEHLNFIDPSNVPTVRKVHIIFLQLFL